MAKIQAWNKLKLYDKVPISTQVFSAIKYKKQLWTGSQCKRLDYVDINHFLTKISTQTMST